MMSAEFAEFVLLVQRSRRATKAYFRSRAKDDLTVARKTEEEVDKEVTRLLGQWEKQNDPWEPQGPTETMRPSPN